MSDKERAAWIKGFTKGRDAACRAIYGMVSLACLDGATKKEREYAKRRVRHAVAALKGLPTETLRAVRVRASR